MVQLQPARCLSVYCIVSIVSDMARPQKIMCCVAVAVYDFLGIGLRIRSVSFEDRISG